MKTNILKQCLMLIWAAFIVLLSQGGYSQEMADGTTPEAPAVREATPTKPMEYPAEFEKQREEIRKKHKETLLKHINSHNEGFHYEDDLRQIMYLYERGVLGEEDFDELWADVCQRQIAAFRSELKEYEEKDDISQFMRLGDMLIQSRCNPDVIKSVIDDYCEAIPRFIDKRIAQCGNDGDYFRLEMMMRKLGRFLPDKSILDEKRKEIHASKNAKAIKEFRDILKTREVLIQGKRIMDKLAQMGLSEEEWQKLVEEFREALGRRVLDEVQNMAPRVDNRAELSGYYSMLEANGVKGDCLLEVKRKLDQIDVAEKKLRFKEMLFRDYFSDAYDMLKKAKEDGLSDEEVSQWRQEFYENYKEYFQRLVWRTIGQDDYSRGNPEDILKEATNMGVDEASIEKWRQEIRAAVRTWYMRHLRFFLMPESIFGLSRLMGAAAAQGAAGGELLTEMRNQASETMTKEIRRLLEFGEFSKAVNCVTELERCGCQIPEEISQAINEARHEAAIEQFFEDSYEDFSDPDIDPERLQRIKERAAELGITEEVLNEWIKDARE